MNVRIVMAIIVATVAMGVAQTSMANPPPPPHGVVLRPGMQWCPKCGGDGTHGHYWWGGRKPCRTCNGSGMVVRVAPTPPPPPPAVHHPKPQKAPPPPAKPHGGPGPKPGPGPKGGHR